MNADVLHAEETERIIGCAFTVLNTLGLKATSLEVGLILNFKRAKLEFRRVSLTKPSQPAFQS